MSETTKWTDVLPSNACQDARDWAKTQPDLATAWARCERADWMLWLAGYWCDRRDVVRAACDCAEMALDHIKDGGRQMMAILALHIAREWCDGREDLETVRIAASAASAADAASAAAAHAAAADAAHAAYAAAAAYAYAYAAYAYAYAYAAARKAALKDMADLVRARIPQITPPAASRAA